MDNILEKAIRIAVNTHYGQTDKGGEPYIFHALRVMNNVNTIEEKIVAILHDIMEDTDITADDLRAEDIPEALINQLLVLSYSPDTAYNAYIEQIAKFPIAATVKLADLKDNMDITRLREITDKDIQRLEKYHISYSFLMEKLNDNKFEPNER
ncbi:GTP pyrophosphokinase [Dysgonomonas termitidis]|uniref:GTP pyrophosphokinase n=1 Tax=Dysgonomonas termitidis TaxID=1516126 RepID=A0ABV9KXV7_9BACT